MIKNEMTFKSEGYKTFNDIRECMRNKDTIPVADAGLQSVRQIGSIITASASAIDAFGEGLFGAFGKYVSMTFGYNSHFSKFYKGLMEYGDVITIRRPKTFYGEAVDTMPNSNLNASRTGSDVDAPHRKGVDTQYIATNLRTKYCDTIDDMELRRAFNSWDDFNDFVNAKFDMMMSMEQVDEEVVFKYLALKAIDNVTPKTLASGYTQADYVTKIKTEAAKLDFYNTNNIAGVGNAADGDLNIMLSVDDDVALDVNFYATLFHTDRADLDGRVTRISQWSFTDDELLRLASLGVVDSKTSSATGYTQVGTSGVYIKNADMPTVTTSKVKAMIFSDDLFQIYDKLRQTSSRYNQSDLFTNYWLHIEQIWATSKFAPFVAICEA